MQILQKDSKQANAHYESKYSGSQGAVVVSRGEYLQAKSNLEFCPLPTKQYELYVKRKLVAYISTLCSAIVPTALKLRPQEAYGYLEELQRMLHVLKGMTYQDLTPTEMEVTVAALLKAWPFGAPGWATEDAVDLSEELIKKETSQERTVATYATVLLAKARISNLRLPDDEWTRKRATYHRQVWAAIRYVRRFGLHDELNDWSTVARLASLVGARGIMHYAARMDGRPDVLIKYGPLHLKVLAIWRARKT